MRAAIEIIILSLPHECFHLDMNRGYLLTVPRTDMHLTSVTTSNNLELSDNSYVLNVSVQGVNIGKIVTGL